MEGEPELGHKVGERCGRPPTDKWTRIRLEGSVVAVEDGGE
jgi:hypothetical protein